ncbi:hypothetical protein JTB14_029788 [Gonioctena quinquepunctata]|nr:hypothetical protein JTB14_029788 [Gonioctena quinquepunctata]
MSYFIKDEFFESQANLPLQSYMVGEAEADSDAEDQLNALDTESASRSGRNTSSAASSTSCVFTNPPVTADYNLDETITDETLAEVVPDSQVCDKTEHNLSPDVPNNSEIGKEVPVKEPIRVEETADEVDYLEWLEDSEYCLYEKHFVFSRNFLR